MTPYQVAFTVKCLNDLEALDKQVAEDVRRRMKWLSENFESITPEALTGDLKGLFKFKVGRDYRFVYEMNRSKRMLTIHRIRHRSKVYRD